MQNQDQDITKSQLDSLRQYRTAVYWSATLSLLTLILFIVLRTLYSPANLFFISESIDNIFFEIMIVCSSTFFSAALIGIIYEKFQTKIVYDDSLVRERFIDEGILRVYKSSTDAGLLELILAEIKNSKSEIIAVGLGLGILSHNYQLLEAIAERVNKIDNFRLKIFLGSANNKGVQNRINEEKVVHDKNNLNYDESWVTRYPSEINGVLKNLIDSSNLHRFQLTEIDTCPMVAVIKVDNLFFFFPYGTPNIKGSRSPWIIIDGNSTKSAMVKFLNDIIKFYE